MTFYVPDLYQKDQQGARLDKRHMIPGVNIISRKASVPGVKGARGAMSPSAGDLGWVEPPKKIFRL